MNIVVGSAHRNNHRRVPGYMDRVAELRDSIANTDNVRVIAVEGDSRDDTRARLVREADKHGLDLDLVICEHGGPIFGSTEDLERFKALSKVGNAIFEAVRQEDDLLFYVESDILWSVNTAIELLQLAATHQVVVPMVLAGEHFYDTWAFRGLDGGRFAPFKPYHNSLLSELTKVGSAGSCLAMQANIARDCRITQDDCLVGWCRNARKLGYSINVASNLSVRHPA